VSWVGRWCARLWSGAPGDILSCWRYACRNPPFRVLVVCVIASSVEPQHMTPSAPATLSAAPCPASRCRCRTRRAAQQQCGLRSRLAAVCGLHLKSRALASGPRRAAPPQGTRLRTRHWHWLAGPSSYRPPPWFALARTATWRPLSGPLTLIHSKAFRLRATACVNCVPCAGPLAAPEPSRKPGRRDHAACPNQHTPGRRIIICTTTEPTALAPLTPKSAVLPPSAGRPRRVIAAPLTCLPAEDMISSPLRPRLLPRPSCFTHLASIAPYIQPEHRPWQ
jgi:hypothetical protein